MRIVNNAMGAVRMIAPVGRAAIRRYYRRIICTFALQSAARRLRGMIDVEWVAMGNLKWTRISTPMVFI